MELRLQPKPEVEILPADQGVVSREQFFVKKKFEQINQYFFPGHIIRNWRPKAELIYPSFPDEKAIQFEYDFNRNVQNCFVEDYAEEVFLRSPPPCFVIIGKSGQNVIKLGQKIAEHYGSVLIQVDNIIQNIIGRQTETSKILERLLKHGVSLTLNFILALLSYIAHTAEARHRGYVLCGLPRIPLQYDLSVEQQLNYLFLWENKPTVFIHVLFEDEDLIKQKTSLLCEIANVDNEKCVLYHSDCEDFAQDGNDIEEGNDISIKEDIFCNRNQNISPSRPWVRLPSNSKSRVWLELEEFDNIIRPCIQLVKSRIDPQYFITVDFRVNNEFEIILARLSLLQIWKVPLARPFISQDSLESSEFDKQYVNEEKDNSDKSDYDIEINLAAEEPPEIAFLKFLNKKTISPKFKWELSHYNYVCPVSLREGRVIEGKSEFAVIFLKYIYFLRDKICMKKFIENPRAYVLPIRPQPLCRFVILGYPLSGKTSLAKTLSSEFCIPLLDTNVILKNDLERKKNTYQKFCQQKAECREIIRLTSQAWQDWRMEEEQRLSLIEEWILYIQIILSQRIEEFYSGSSSDNASTRSIRFPVFSAVKHNVRKKHSDDKIDPKSSKEKINTHYFTEPEIPLPRENPSAFKNVSFIESSYVAFHEKESQERVNLFVSSLWRSFSSEINKFYHRKEEEAGEFEELEEKSNNSESESDIVNWCSLLPPQSLSSFLINKKSEYTPKERRHSFKVLLEAASKAYWEPSILKTEFAKWRLPCYMDIPLCELFLENPCLLLKYVPGWLKERPLFPGSVDPMHPSVLEAGRKAFLRAEVVSVQHSQEEIAILLRDAIEKAEKDGMRVTGEIISPGGWVIDNMPLNLKVWNKLACEKVFPDHIYVLVDNDSDFAQIITSWWNLWGNFIKEDVEEFENKNSIEDDFKVQLHETEDEDIIEPIHKNSEQQNADKEDQKSMIQYLADKVAADAYGDEELDSIYNVLVNNTFETEKYIPPFSVDSFSHNLLRNSVQTWISLKEETLNGEALLAIQNFANASSFTGNACNFFCHQQIYPSVYSSSLGAQLENVTDQIINFFEKNFLEKNSSTKTKISSSKALEFFIHLLTIPKKLQQLKDWFCSINQDNLVKEIEVNGKSCEEIYLEIKQNLMEKFIKKPRELENFEVEEINNFNDSPPDSVTDKNFVKEEFDSNDKEDLRIFGESGPLCIVNLEKNIFLLGKPEFSLKYYGKLYYFWDQESKNLFLQNPEKYAPYYSAIRCYPPLRIYVMGPVGSGKTTVGMSLANQCSTTIVDYAKFLKQSLAPHLDVQSGKFVALGNSKLLLSEDHNSAAKIAKECFINASFTKRQFWLDNSFYSEFLENNKFVDKLINLSEPVAPKTYSELSYKRVHLLSENRYDYFYGEAGILPQSLLEFNQTDYTNMTDIEEIISKYFKNESDLNDYCVEKSLKALWTRDPYLTKGFVLDGFPMRLFDLKNIYENHWIPNVVVEIILPEQEVVDRNIGTLMEAWDTKLKQDIIEEKLLEDTLETLRTINMTLRRNELIREKKLDPIQGNQNEGEEYAFDISQTNEMIEETAVNSKITSKTKKISMKKPEIHETLENFIPEVSSETETEVDLILKNEYPPFVFNPVFESYEAAKTRITEKIVENYKIDYAEIGKLKSALINLNVTWLEIDGFQNIQETMQNLFLKLDKIKNQTEIKGEFAFSVSMDMAEKLLQQGYYFLSKFGKWCPVQIYRYKNPINMFRPLSKRNKITPIVYRNYVYFVGGENEKKKFLENPIKYTFNETRLPNIPLRVAVIGPPKSGKTTLCERLKTMFDLQVITMGTALRFALENTPESTLAKSIKNYLKRGCFLPLSLKVEALILSLNTPSCATQGFVFDGIPFDAAFTQSLAEKGKLPFVIISLIANSDLAKSYQRNLDLNKFRLPYKNRTNLNSKYEDWEETYKKFVQWNQDTYNNLYEINAKLSEVDIFYKAYDIIRKSFFGILNYVENSVNNKALPLQYLCITPQEYELRKSCICNSCPVCWVELQKFSIPKDTFSRSHLVQYLNYFYFICPLHTKKFLRNPSKYVFPVARQWPKLVPKVIKKSDLKKMVELKIHGFGRCPVTKTDFPDNLSWEGTYDFGAVYGDEVFFFKNQEMLDRFLSRPWRYCKANTEFEVNRRTKSKALEQLGPPVVTSLPPIGFLEQTVADLIHKCLQILGVLRPIYPNMSPTTTGCTFLGLYLKVFNKKNPQLSVKEYLDYMHEYCGALKFKVYYNSIREKTKEIEDRDVESENDSGLSEKSAEVHSASASEMHIQSSDVFWLDFESRISDKIWSAKFSSDKKTEMKLTLKDELLEISETPKRNVIVRYKMSHMRLNPLPFLGNCLNFLYTCRKALAIPEKFNYNTLYQKLPNSFFPTNSKNLFNPERQFSLLLHKESQPGFPSVMDMQTCDRVHSVSSAEEFKSRLKTDMDSELMKKNFVPRFKLLDTITTQTVPRAPKVIEEKPIFYNPHREYTYTMLLSQFFHTTHVLRCYQWDDIQQLFEYTSQLNKNLALTNVKVEFFNKPKKTDSEKSQSSILGYQKTFDAATSFAFRSSVDDSTDDSSSESSATPLYNFIQTVLFQKLDEVFHQISRSRLSYDAYEINVADSRCSVFDKGSILIEEILPYPPLIWDIISRPYYAYRALHSIFNKPPLDNIAHERHISLLDGLTDVNDHFRFVSYPSSIEENTDTKPNSTLTELTVARKVSRIPVYFYYDFFNMPWTSFFIYPYQWAQSVEITNQITKTDSDTNQLSDYNLI